MTGKLRSVQALRAVAVLLVVGVHIGNRYGVESRYLGAPHLTGWMRLPGSAGVDLFFVISGVIIMTTAWPAFSTRGAARQFAYRRLTRIFPPYWVVSALVLVVYLIRPHLVNSHDVHRPEVLQSLLILPQRGDPLLAVGWTLVYELYFYAIFSFALLFPRRLLPWIVGGWATATLALHLAVGPTKDPSLFVVANPMNLEFVFGVAIGYLIVRRTLVAPRLLFAASLLALAVLFGHLAISNPADFPSAAYRVGAVGAAFAVLVYAAVGLELLRGVRTPRVLERVGDGSYSIYLWHVPVLSVIGLAIERVFPAPLPFHLLGLAFVFAAAVFSGVVLYELIERPLLRAFHTRRFGAAAGVDSSPIRRWRARAKAAI
ncbi:MAG: acyltransferase family protein [Thermoleophilaceae bacterium]